MLHNFMQEVSTHKEDLEAHCSKSKVRPVSYSKAHCGCQLIGLTVEGTCALFMRLHQAPGKVLWLHTCLLGKDSSSSDMNSLLFPVGPL